MNKMVKEPNRQSAISICYVCCHQTARVLCYTVHIQTILLFLITVNAISDMMKLSAANFKKHITLQTLDLNVEALQGIVHAGNNYDFVDTFEADRL